MTGQLTKRIDVGRELVNFVLLDGVYALVTQRDSASCVDRDIYGLSQSTPTHRICTLEFPPEETKTFPVSCQISTGERPASSNGHFRGDPSQTMVSITLTTNDVQHEYASVLLIPHATIIAQIQAAESRKPEGDAAELARRVGWEDWGPRGCLRLRLQLPHRSYDISLLPCGSRAPIIAFRGSDYKTDEFFVFDVNPLSARYTKHVLAMRRNQSDSEPEGTAIVEDVEDVLPGVVDPECSAITYVVYRFKLPYTCRSMDWSVGGLTIKAVEMSMAGFTVKFDGVSFEESLQTWTV
ncbi:hypothetical protein V8D89_009425 [Ganoderma adspersum]